MAQNNNFWVDMIANLKKSQSKKQVQTDAKKLGDIFVSLIGTLNKAKTKTQLKKDLQSINPTVDLTTKINKKSVNTSVQQTVKQAQATAKKNPVKIDAMLDLKKSKLLSDIRYFGQQNSKLFKDAGLTSRYNSLLDNAKLASSGKEIRNLRLQLSAMRSELKATNMSGLSLGDTLKKTFKRAVELFSGTGFVMLISQQLREAWTEALNLDKSYTDLIKVQDRLTRGDYPEYLEQCNKKAKDLATTQKALIEGVTEFSKSGYDLTTSNKLSEQSTVLSNVGEMDASSSAKAIISGVQAFEQVQGYTDVIDKAKILIDIYNEIGNTSAITTKEIAEGVQSVGSVFADANTSVEEFVSLLSAGNRQYQDADEMALALRTAALRLRGAKVELEAMGEETEGMITSVSKLEEKIKALTDIDGVGGMEGVSLLEADGKTFRSIYDIFLDISKVYQDMADVDQSALLELVSGKHRASAISATLNNMAEAQEIYKRSLEASGSAQEEYSKYLESSEASLNRFKASMTETYQSVINGETVKGILDTGNATLEFANSIGLVESSLKGLIAIGVVKAMTALSTAFKASAISASNFGTALNTVKSMSAMTQGTTEYANALKSLKMVSSGLTEAQLKQVLANKSLDNSSRISILRATGLTKAQSQARLSQMGLTQSTKAQTVAQNSATASTFSLTSAIKGFSVSLKAAFMSNPVGISIMALSTLIGAVSSKVSDYNEEIRETRQANMDSSNSAMEEAKGLNDLFIQYKNLSSITDKTSQQEEDFKQVIEDITEALGDKAEILEGLTEGTDKYSESLEKATKAELENQYATAKVGAKAAADALEEKTYSAWDGSKVSILKNEQMTGIKEHVAALEVVEDILAKYEDMSSYGVEWEPIGWDDNRHDMNAVVEYYNDLIEARTKLVTADNADFLMSSDIYEDINTTINNLSASVEEYTKQQYNALKLNYEWQNGIPSTKAEFEAMEKSILEASGAGEEFQKILKDYLAQDFSTLIALPDTEIDVDTGGAEQELTKLFDKLTTSKDALSKFVSSVQSATEAYSNLMNPNISSTDILSSIQSINEAVSEMGGRLNWEFIDSQENSLELLGNTIEHISRKYAESVLSGAGIDVNSKFGQMLANNIIQAQKASEQLSSLNTNIDSLQSAYSDLTDIVEAYNETGYLTFDQLQTLLELEPQYLQCLIDENGQLQLNEQAMVALANQRLNDAEAQAVSQAISELGTLALHDEKVAVEENASAFSKAIGDLSGYNAELANTIAEATVGASAIRDLNAAIKGAEAEGATDDQINTVLSNLETKLQAINSVRDKLNTGGLGSVMGNKKSSSSKDTTETFDWIERAIEDIESDISQLDKVVDSMFSTVEAKNKALVDQIGLINKEIELQQQAYEGYMAKAESVGLSDKYKNLVQSGAINIEDITDKDLQNAIKLYQDYYDKAQDTLEKINDLHEGAKQKHVDGYELEADELKRKLDTQSITEKQYIDDMLALWERYYENQVEYAEIAKEKKLDLLDEEKSYLQSVGSAAIAFLDDQIDDLEEQKDSAVQGFKDQIKVLEKLKKPLEDQLEMMEKAREKEEKILALQQAQYALKRAQSQRDKLTYVDGQMVYRNDDKAVRDAQNDVDDAEFELAKFKIQEQIDAYDRQIDALNVLIDDTEKYYDDQIKGLNKYKDEWQKAIDMEELAVNMQNFIDKFGEGSIGKLLSGDMSLITDWKQSYLDTLAEIDMTSTGTIGDITNKFKELSGLDFSPSVTGISEASDKMTELADSANNAASAIGGATGVENAQQGEDGQGGSNAGGGTNLVGAIGEVKTATDTALGSNGGEGKDGESSEGSGEGAIGKFSQFKTAVDAVTQAIGTGEEEEGSGEEGAINLIGALQTQYEIASEILPEEIAFFNELLASITACVDGLNAMASSISSVSGVSVAPHAEGTVGKAFANGTGNYKGLAHAEKNALRSEYGQPELTVYPDGTTELTTEPTMSDLPKDTVIFNEEQTKRIMNNEGTIIGNAHADGNAVLQKAELPSYLRPIQEGDKGYELIKAARVYQDMLKTNIMLPINSIDKNVEMMTRNINNVNTNNVNKPTLTINGGINVSCPAVNSKEIMNQVSTALHREIGGIALEALQEASITR